MAIQKLNLSPKFKQGLTSIKEYEERFGPIPSYMFAESEHKTTMREIRKALRDGKPSPKIEGRPSTT